MARPKNSSGSQTQERILHHALSQIARLGYGAVSMRMIADAVGVNASALYNHFPTKQSILVRLLSDHMNGLQSAWDDQSIDLKFPIEAMDKFARFHIRYNLARPDEVFISYMELRALEPENFEVIENQRRLYENVPRSIIAAGVKTGAFVTEDIHVSTMAVLACLTGVNTWYKTTGRLSAREIENHTATVVLRSLGVTQEDLNV